MAAPLLIDDQDARTQRHLAVLDTLIAQGADLATRVHQQSTTPSDLCSALAAPGQAIPYIAPEIIASFAQINQTIRRAILLSRKLAEPLPRAPRTPTIRQVEDTIDREARAETLRADLHERVESGDLDEHVGNRPVHEIIAEICRNLAIVSASEQARFELRDPHDLQTPNARAAHPSRYPIERPGHAAEAMTRHSWRGPEPPKR